MLAAFLDRDGVIIRKAPEGDYVARWEEVEFLPDALESVASLYRAGFKIIIVTNQRGIATGKVQPEDLEHIHHRLRTQLAMHGVAVAGIYVCPHDIPENCDCRKPKPGMLLEAAREHGIDLAGSWMVGDMASDIAAGKSAGCRTAWIVSEGARREPEVEPDILADSLLSAVRQILGWASGVPGDSHGP